MKLYLKLGIWDEILHFKSVSLKKKKTTKEGEEKGGGGVPSE